MVKEKKDKEEKKDKFKSALSELKKLKEEKKKTDVNFLSNRIEHPEQREKLNYQRDLSQVESKKKISSAKVKVIGAYGERTRERIESVVSRVLKKPLLKKPHAKVKTISNRALMKQFAGSGYRMFKSEPKSYSEQPEQDNRSIFFQSEFNKEKRRML